MAAAIPAEERVVSNQMARTRYVGRRRFLRDSALATIGVMAAACTPASTTPSPSGTPAPKKGGEFHGAWPWDAPPKGHYNYFAPGAILSGSIYTDLFIPSLAMYRWTEAKWDYLLAESAAPTEAASYEVKLRSGIKWSDGVPFTAKDVATTFWVGRLLGTAGIWGYVDRIDVTGDLSLRFHVTRPSSLIDRLVLRNPIRPDSVYGAFAKRAQDLVAANRKATDDDWKAAAKDVGDLRPATFPSVGPYKIDEPSVTAAQLVLNRNAAGVRADRVNFDRVLLYQAENAQASTPLVLAGDVDYANYSFSLAIDKAFVDQGLRVARTPLHTGPAIYFHWVNAPQFQDRRLRQAVAIAINRVESGKIAYGESGRASKLMIGYSDTLVASWVSRDDQKKLRSYDYDVARADALLREAGYAKAADGVYAKDGRRLELELYYPSDFADWSSAATHAADALNRLGMKITPRGAPSAQQQADLRSGSFVMAIGPWGISHPHPQQSLIRPLREFNTQASGGQRYPLKQQTSSGDVDLGDLLDRSVDGYDVTKQKDAIAKLTLAFNELLPCVPLWERYTNNPLNEKKRVDGWKPDGDAIYTQGAGDSFAALLLLDGTLHRI